MLEGKRQKLARVLCACGAFPAASYLRQFISSEVSILAYHRVLDVGQEERYSFDLDLVSASPTAFAWQMAYIKRHYAPITFATLLECLDGKAKLPRRAVIVTFDDGFDDNYRFAFPILRDLGVPATFFISSDYIGKVHTFWFERVVYILGSTEETRLDVAGFGRHELPPQLAARKRIAYALLEYLKRVSDPQRHEILQSLERDLGARCAVADPAQSRPMTWAQVREMASSGMEFGSHTATHPILANLDDAALRRELADSKDTIEGNIGQRVQTIAYPVGRSHAFDERTVRMSRELGYRLGVSYIPGVVAPRDLNDPYRLKRLHVERYTTPRLFSAMMGLPRLFHTM